MTTTQKGCYPNVKACTLQLFQKIAYNTVCKLKIIEKRLIYEK